MTARSARVLMTVIINAILVLTLVISCAYERPAVSTTAQAQVAAADTAQPYTAPSEAVLYASDLSNPVLRQDHFWWAPPLCAYGVPEHYEIRYQKPGSDAWRHYGISVENIVWLPQSYRPYRLQVRAYFEHRVWLADKSAGYGSWSEPSAWIGLSKPPDPDIKPRDETP